YTRAMMGPARRRENAPLHVMSRGAALLAAVSFGLLLLAAFLLLRVPSPSAPAFSSAIGPTAEAIPTPSPAPNSVEHGTPQNTGPVNREEPPAPEVALAEPTDSAVSSSYESVLERYIAPSARATQRSTLVTPVVLVADEPPAARPLDRSAERRAKRIAQFGGT